MKKENGFTLVELLAVIVILAIILVIAVPQIQNTIKGARKGSFESSAKMIASAAENWYQTKSVLGESTTTPPACTDVAKISPDISGGTCDITITNGIAYVTINNIASGKFQGCTISNATKTGSVAATGGNCGS